MRKLAVLRDNESKPCPFGLGIPYSCQKVGQSITNMIPLSMSEDKENEIRQTNEKIRKTNTSVFLWQATGERCIYADKIVGKEVNCTFTERQENRNDIIGSPLYTKMFTGTAANGIYTSPSAYYNESPMNRGPFFGMYGVESLGSDQNDLQKSSNKKE